MNSNSISTKTGKILDIFLHFWNLHQILNIFKKQMSLIATYFRNYKLQNVWLHKCLKSQNTYGESTNTYGEC